MQTLFNYGDTVKTPEGKIGVVTRVKERYTGITYLVKLDPKFTAREYWEWELEASE